MRKRNWHDEDEVPGAFAKGSKFIRVLNGHMVYALSVGAGSPQLIVRTERRVQGGRIHGVFRGALRACGCVWGGGLQRAEMGKMAVKLSSAFSRPVSSTEECVWADLWFLFSS